MPYGDIFFFSGGSGIKYRLIIQSSKNERTIFLSLAIHKNSNHFSIESYQSPSKNPTMNNLKTSKLKYDKFKKNKNKNILKQEQFLQIMSLSIFSIDGMGFLQVPPLIHCFFPFKSLWFNGDQLIIYFKAKKTMFNQISTNIPVYYCLQPQNLAYSPFLLPNGGSLIMTSYVPFDIQMSSGRQERMLERQNCSCPLNGGLRKPTTDSSYGSSESVAGKGLIIKEKLIKKPANRPTSYLTERKYYLAQPPPENHESERKLRPRKTKKKNRRNIQSFLSKSENGVGFTEGRQNHENSALEYVPLEECEVRGDNLRIVGLEGQESIFFVKIEGQAVPANRSE